MRTKFGREAGNVVARIEAFNAGRDVERLALKYRAIAASPFTFLRGTCHLFAEDFPRGGTLGAFPRTWICGDLHLENFGSYKGDNRLAYFDLSDFDEALLAPASWDLARFLVSVLVAAETLQLAAPAAAALGDSFLDAYVAALLTGKARWVERATATGMVRDLLRGLRRRSRAVFLAGRTEVKGGKRRLRVDGRKALPASAAQRQEVVSFVSGFAATQSMPEFFEVLDVARRIAGTGSLGIERYVILVRGRGDADGNFLLDLKHQPGSALAPRVRIAQPAWATEAERVVAIQRRLQADSPAFLAAVTLGGRACVLRELQPSQDRLALGLWNGKLRRLQGVMRTMGEVVAWAQLRSGGRQGSACADEWIDFAARSGDWRPALLDYAQAYRSRVLGDWQEFAADYRCRRPRSML